jgi:hypothetical protein
MLTKKQKLFFIAKVKACQAARQRFRLRNLGRQFDQSCISGELLHFACLRFISVLPLLNDFERQAQSNSKDVGKLTKALKRTLSSKGIDKDLISIRSCKKWISTDLPLKADYVNYVRVLYRKLEDL